MSLDQSRSTSMSAVLSEEECDDLRDMTHRSTPTSEKSSLLLVFVACAVRELVIQRMGELHSRELEGAHVATRSASDGGADPVCIDAAHRIAEALNALAGLEPQLAQTVDLKFFCGFTLSEIACMQLVSERTVRRRWEKARLLLSSAVNGD